jgi:hypothetical protein
VTGVAEGKGQEIDRINRIFRINRILPLRLTPSY